MRSRPPPSGRGPGRAPIRDSGCSRRAARPASRPVPASRLRASRGDLARRQAGQRPDAVGVDRSIAEDGAGDRHHLVRAGRIDDGLRGRRLVVAEGDRRRTGQERREGLPDRVLGGDAQEAVLDDAVRHVLLAQGAADLRDLLHGEAAVLGDDQRPAAGERLAQFGDGLPFGLCGHPMPSFRRTAGARRWRAADPVSPGIATPLRRRLFGWPDTQGRCHRDGGRTGLPRRARRRPRSLVAIDPIRRIKPRPSPSWGRGPRAQAVSGCPVDLQL